MLTFKQFVVKKPNYKSDRSHRFHWDLNKLTFNIKEETQSFGTYDNPKISDNRNITPQKIKYDRKTKKTGVQERDQFIDHHNKLTDDQKNALSDYKYDAAATVNGYLRNGEKTISSEEKPTVNSYIKDLDRATSFKVKHPTVVYRGISSKRSSPIHPKNLKAGDTFTDKAYASTSFNKNEASDFGFTDKTKNTPKGVKARHVFAVHLKKGDRAHYIDHPAYSGGSVQIGRAHV